MDVNLRDLRSVRNPKVRIKIMQGHFARSHSHVNTYIDISTIKSRCDHAREAARMLTEPYLSSAEGDTTGSPGGIVCLDGMEVVGAFMAELLAAPGSVSVNRGKNISIVAPESNQLGQMMFRDNTKRMVGGQNVLILAGSLNTGKTMLQAIDTILYYGGGGNGGGSKFRAASKVAGLDIHAAFTTADIPDYQVYPSHACPLCKAGVKVDAIVNSYGYSEL